MRRILLTLLALAALLHCTALAEPFPFVLPEEFSLEQRSDTEWDILCQEATVGGVVLPPLEASCVEAPDESPLLNYLSDYVTPPLAMDYMLEWGNGLCTATLILVNPETMECREQLHCLFVREDQLFDLWLDREQISPDVERRILDVTGILPRAEVPFPMPEGYIAVDLGVEYIILRDIDQVGGILATELDFAAMTTEDVRAYLDSITSPEQLPEYVISFSHDRYASASYRASAMASGKVVFQQSHFLFLQDGVCYDLWLDRESVDSEQEGAFLAALGLQ